MGIRNRITAYFDNISIFKKLMVSFLLLALLPVICIGAISYMLTYHTMYIDVARSVDINQSRIADTLGERLSQMDQFLSEAIYSREFQQLAMGYDSGLVDFSALEEACREMMTGAELSLKIQEAVYTPSPYSGSGHLERAGPAAYQICVTQHGSSLRFAKRVCNLYTEQIMGELTISVSLFSFLDEYLQMDKEEYGLLLYDRQDQEVFSNWHIAADTGHPTADYLKHQTGSVCTVNGVRYITARESFPLAGWELYCLVPQRLVQSQVDTILWTTVSTVLVCAVTIVLLSLFVSYTMTYRLNIMVSRVKNYRVDDLRLNHRHDLGGDEIGQLAVFFDHMEHRNAVLIQEVYESKLEQKEAELKALQAQINPHFLYNCLDNINIRSLVLGDTQISNVVTMLADFYRTSLNKGRSTTTVGNEIKNVTTYLSLLTALGGKFRVEYDIDPDVTHYTMISLTLQPIVENAYQHGAFYIGAEGYIRLRIQKRQQRLYLSVFNNGSRITREQARKALEQKGKGYGLKNVNTRIQLFFGKEYGVDIAAVEGGTECVVTIPAWPYEPEEEADEPD